MSLLLLSCGTKRELRRARKENGLQFCTDHLKQQTKPVLVSSSLRFPMIGDQVTMKIR